MGGGQMDPDHVAGVHGKSVEIYFTGSADRALNRLPAGERCLSCGSGSHGGKRENQRAHTDPYGCSLGFAKSSHSSLAFPEMLPAPAVRYYPANGRALFYHSYGQVLSFSVSWGPSDSAVRLIGNGETAG